MSSPIVTPELTPSPETDSQPQGPPTTCPGSSQPLPTESQPEERRIRKTNTSWARPIQSIEEMYAGFSALLATNIALQELWFAAMVR